MAYFTSETSTPAAVVIGNGTGTGGIATFQAPEPGQGYPKAAANSYYPNMPAQGTTNNPHGIANSPDEIPAVIANPPGTPYAYAYSFRTWEAKAAATIPPGVFA